MRRSLRAAAAGAPNLGWFLLEGHRAFFEGLALAPAAGLLARAPRGDGHPVLVLPGFTAGDASTPSGTLAHCACASSPPATVWNGRRFIFSRSLSQ